MSIVYGKDSQTLDLIADSEDQLSVWYRGLKHLIRIANQARETAQCDQSYVQSKYESAVKSNSTSLTKEEFTNLLWQMNIRSSKRAIDAAIAQTFGEDKAVLTYSDYIKVMTYFQRRFYAELMYSFVFILQL